MDDGIRSGKHVSTIDTESINKAIEKASKDRNFISYAVDQLKGLNFPAYKAQMIDFVKMKSANKDVTSLFESLNDSSLYQDLYQVK